MAAIVNDDYQFTGQVVFSGAVYLPTGSVENDDVKAAAGISASKLQSQRDICGELFESATAIAALTRLIYAAKGAGTLLSFKSWIEVVATGGDRTVAVDLKKSTAGGAWASVLSATSNYTNGSSVRTLVAGTINNASYVAGDLFQVVVAVAGAAGDQAKGLGFQLLADEAY